MKKIYDSFTKAEYSVIWWYDDGKHTLSVTWGDGAKIKDCLDWDDAHFEFTTTCHQILMEVDVLRPARMKDWTPESDKWIDELDNDEPYEPKVKPERINLDDF